MVRKPEEEKARDGCSGEGNQKCQTKGAPAQKQIGKIKNRSHDKQPNGEAGDETHVISQPPFLPVLALIQASRRHDAQHHEGKNNGLGKDWTYDFFMTCMNVQETYGNANVHRGKKNKNLCNSQEQKLL
jgi:hypothetical protein